MAWYRLTHFCFDSLLVEIEHDALENYYFIQVHRIHHRVRVTSFVITLVIWGHIVSQLSKGILSFNGVSTLNLHCLKT